MGTIDGQQVILEKRTDTMCPFSELSIGHLFYTASGDGDICIKISAAATNNIFNYEKTQIESHDAEVTVFKAKKQYIRGEW